MKAFDLAMFCGRFQHIHIGHEHVIDTALKLADRVLVLVGSAQEAGTSRNPFDIQTRMEMIREIYPQNNIIIKPLPDLTHEDDITFDWGKYVLGNVKKFAQKKPELFVYGNDESRSKWFDPTDIKEVTEIIISRSKIDISATRMRQFLVNDDIDNWLAFSNPRLHKHYNRLRRELLSAEAYQITA
jgi:bifunctional NMN adenylyltransferase/nudix hydrolase